MGMTTNHQTIHTLTSSGDLPLLERLMGDPRITEHLGSQASEQERQAPPGPAAATPMAQDRAGQTASLADQAAHDRSGPPAEQCSQPLSD